MRIKTIGYGITQNTGNYENQKLYIEAEVSDDEDPNIAFKLLKTRLWEEANQLTDGRRKVGSLQSEIYNLENLIEIAQSRLRRAELTWDTLKIQWDEAVNLLQRHGLKPRAEFPTTPSFKLFDPSENSNLMTSLDNFLNDDSDDTETEKPYENPFENPADDQDSEDSDDSEQNAYSEPGGGDDAISDNSYFLGNDDGGGNDF